MLSAVKTSTAALYLGGDWQRLTLFDSPHVLLYQRIEIVLFQQWDNKRDKGNWIILVSDDCCGQFPVSNNSRGNLVEGINNVIDGGHDLYGILIGKRATILIWEAILEEM